MKLLNKIRAKRLKGKYVKLLKVICYNPKKRADKDRFNPYDKGMIDIKPPTCGRVLDYKYDKKWNEIFILLKINDTNLAFTLKDFYINFSVLKNEEEYRMEML